MVVTGISASLQRAMDIEMQAVGVDAVSAPLLSRSTLKTTIGARPPGPASIPPTKQVPARAVISALA